MRLMILSLESGNSTFLTSRTALGRILFGISTLQLSRNPVYGWLLIKLTLKVLLKYLGGLPKLGREREFHSRFEAAKLDQVIIQAVGETSLLRRRTSVLVHSSLNGMIPGHSSGRRFPTNCPTGIERNVESPTIDPIAIVRTTGDGSRTTVVRINRIVRQLFIVLYTSQAPF